MEWQVGKVRISTLIEARSTTLGGILPLATPETLAETPWLAPDFITGDGDLKANYQVMIVQTPEVLMMVDTCIGNDKERPGMDDFHLQQSSFLDDLAASGHAPEDFDIIVCTHMHVDHVGWNTRLVEGAWIPTFPNAEYIVAADEMTFWAENNEATKGDPENLFQTGFNEIQKQVFADSVAPILEAGLYKLVANDAIIAPGISLVHTPGHSPGHVSVRITSEGQTALISGDFVHHPCQIAHTDWATVLDDDPAQSSASRSRVLGDLSGTQTLFIGTHFAEPTAGHIVADGKGFRLKT